MENKGGDSISPFFLGVDLDPNYFKKHSGAHCFFTPTNVGITQFGKLYPIQLAKVEKINWLIQYLKNTTYEVSIPVLWDVNLALSGQTGLMVSTLMDYQFVKSIREEGCMMNLNN